jgi:hypothetical protein
VRVDFVDQEENRERDKRALCACACLFCTVAAHVRALTLPNRACIGGGKHTVRRHRPILLMSFKAKKKKKKKKERRERAMLSSGLSSFFSSFDK